MFTESLLDYSAGRTRRSWSTLVAWTLQTKLIALAVVLPLWHTSALPRVVHIDTFGPPPGRPAPKPSQPVGNPEHVRTTRAVVSDALQAPLHIPEHINRTPEAPHETEVAEAPCTYCVSGGTGPGLGDGVGNFPKVLTPAITITPPPPAPKRVIVSGGVSQGYLLHQVQPVYPAIARAARVQGTVILAAVISRDGVIEGLHAVSGPPMLVEAAIGAVRQWRYRPYLLNNQHVEVETQISVIFTLSH